MKARTKHSADARPGLRQIAIVAVIAVSTVGLLSACGKSADDAISTIAGAETTISQTSDAWRAELQQLSQSLDALEGQASTDSKEAITLAANQVSDLTTQAVDLTDAKAQDLVAQAGVEFRCNAGFVKQGVTSELNQIVANLRFWEAQHKLPTAEPAHTTCWVDPTAAALYPDGGGWKVDTSTMAEKDIVHIYGYDFAADRLPTIELEDAKGNVIRDSTITTAYVTHYQIDLDLSTENFTGVTPGSRLVLAWPDAQDPTTISLTLASGARLQITNPIFSVVKPTATVDPVSLRVTVTNTGGTRSGAYTLLWVPDPQQAMKQSKTRGPLNPGETAVVDFDSYVFPDSGSIPSVVSLDNGDDTETYPLIVARQPSPPVTVKNLAGFPQTITKTGNIIGGYGEDLSLGGMCDPGWHQSGHQVLVLSSYGNAKVEDEGWGASDVSNCSIRVHVSIATHTPAAWIKFQAMITEQQ